jgi:hypothetical protein
MKWDPTGVADTPEPVGEYDGMISPLRHRLSCGTSSITHLISRFAAVLTAPAGAASPPGPRRMSSTT